MDKQGIQDRIIDVLHWGGGVLVLILGLMSAGGIHIPGVEINPAVAIPAGLGILGAGLKSTAQAKNS